MNVPDPPSMAPSSGDPSPVDRALDVFREDCRAARPAADLAERVLAAVARGDEELERFRRAARAYAAAAAVLMALGAGGLFLAHRAESRPAAASALADLEAARLAIEHRVSLADFAVGGR